MPFSAQKVCEAIQPLLIGCSNNNTEFSNVAPVEEFNEQSLIFISSAEQSNNVDKIKPAIIVTNKNIAQVLLEKFDNTCVIAVNNVRLAQSLVKTEFNDYDSGDSEWPNLHSNATIHPSASIGDNVRIGPHVVIGENAKIGNNTIIRSNCVIEKNATIGQDTIIHSLVNVGRDCSIGDRVIIRPGVIIGNEGFGFAQCDNKRYHRIPHTGSVEIHNDVQVGSNCNIDRGTYGKTIISRGVKIDSLCHIAHNVKVGEDTIIVAQTGIAGSSTIGNNVTISGQSAITDHKTICDGAVLVQRCGVTEDIQSPGVWAGTPAKPMKEYVRNLNSSDKIKKLERKLNEKINALDTKLAELEKKV